jgi:DtxR family transcriptional regulator, Mn-dependent transcriptional regulator
MSGKETKEENSRPTHTIEDYLMNLHVMERDHGEIVAARLAEMMDVTPATVAMTLKRMERDAWIKGKGRKKIHLTDTGREAAHSVIRRHMLVEWLLVSVFKMPLYETHDEAHNIEHAISPNLEERMRIILGDPKVCPHGNPLPGFEHVTQGWLPLTELSPGDKVTIRRIHEFAEDNPELLEFLQLHAVVPGTEATLKESLPFNQTLTLSINNNEVTLGFAAAKYIFGEVSK